MGLATKPAPLSSEWVGPNKVEDGGVGIGTIIIVGGIAIVGTAIIIFFPPSASVVAPAMGAGVAAAI